MFDAQTIASYIAETVTCSTPPIIPIRILEVIELFSVGIDAKR